MLWRESVDGGRSWTDPVEVAGRTFPTTLHPSHISVSAVWASTGLLHVLCSTDDGGSFDDVMGTYRSASVLRTRG